jgi:RNA polymerase sigma-70 factor (ECF subfamily)
VHAADDPRSDQHLVDAGDFDALYYRYRDWVASLAHRFTRNHDDALDVLQETFAYLARKFPTLHLTASMKSLLYPAVRNLSLELIRKRRGATVGDDVLDLLPAPFEAADERAELAAALSGIPQTHREVLLMRFVDDLKLEEIASALEIPLGTVKSRLHNALESLRSDPAVRAYFDVPDH